MRWTVRLALIAIWWSARRRLQERLDRHSMAVGADHYGWAETPVCVVVETPADLHPLHGLAAVVTRR
jgi:hypothetical protein